MTLDSSYLLATSYAAAWPRVAWCVASELDSCGTTASLDSCGSRLGAPASADSTRAELGHLGLFHATSWTVAGLHWTVAGLASLQIQ